MNIIWKKPDNTVAITTIFDGSDSKAHAEELSARGDVPGEWVAVAFDYTDPLPTDDLDRLLWNGSGFDVAPLNVAVPTDVDQRQIRRALINRGLYQSAQAAVLKMSDEAQVDWEFEPRVKRNSQLVKEMGVALRLSDAKLDGLFIDAAKI